MLCAICLEVDRMNLTEQSRARGGGGGDRPIYTHKQEKEGDDKGWVKGLEGGGERSQARHS